MGEYDNPRRLMEQAVAPLDRRPTLDCMYVYVCMYVYADGA